jgi:peptide/nickel transport system substrate-binding protein
MMRLRYSLLTAIACACLLAQSLAGQSGGELRFCLRSEPKTLNPLLMEDESSETIRYLTGGVLIRFNRQNQKLEPELATSWRVSDTGREISFQLRSGVSFSDGTPFTADDVAYTMRQLMDPNLHSPTGDTFRSAKGTVEAKVTGSHSVVITFPAPIAGMERLFDQVAILSSHSPKPDLAVLGPFYVAEYKAGASLLLKRNPRYWKRDAAGKSLPYLDSVRLDIEQNRDIELLRFRRGEIQLINSLDAEYFDRLASEIPGATRDAGPSLDSEQMWFNQVSAAPIPSYKRAWFQSANFRRAISEAISREDMVRVVFGGHARPAFGPVSPANEFWFNKALPVPAHDPESALRRLGQDGFHLEGNVLRDRAGNAIEFSLITNAGNKSRERMAAMMQQDLEQIGIRLNVVTLDFPSLIERITRSFNYEACLLGLVNVDVDPNGQMNVWLSSASNHQWNPEQKAPATAWEAEIDGLMQAQAVTTDATKRKEYFDKVQRIIWEEAPFIYLVNKDALMAISPKLGNAHAVVLRPQTYWNAEWLYLVPEKNGVRQ